MKKTVSVIICVVCIISMSACGQKGSTNIPEKENTYVTEEDVIQEEAPIENDNEDTNTNTEEQIAVCSVDPQKEFQTIDGFGAAYTWYSDWIKYCDDTEGLFDSLFSDAKLSILRFKNEYEYNQEDYASNAAAMASYYKAACERSSEYGEKPIVLMCCWSPPASLKTGNDITGGASLKKNQDGEYCYEEYADWWVESIQYYETQGIQVDYVCIQNEIDYAADYDGCRFAVTETDTEASFARAYMAVYDAFQLAFGENAPKMLGPETMSCTTTSMLSYMQDVINEKPESIYGLAHHLYVGGEGDGDTNHVDAASFITGFMQINQIFPEYKKWQTEYYIGHALETALLINNCMVYEQANAYLYWSGTWGELDPSFENTYLIGLTLQEKDRMTESGWRICADYYAIRHFSEFVRPGYVRIQSLTGNRDVASSAYQSVDLTKIALVLINTGEEEQTYQVNISGCDIENGNVYQSVFGDECESADSCYQYLGKQTDTITVILPAKSVTTVDITTR